MRALFILFTTHWIVIWRTTSVGRRRQHLRSSIISSVHRVLSVSPVPSIALSHTMASCESDIAVACAIHDTNIFTHEYTFVLLHNFPLTPLSYHIINHIRSAFVSVRRRSMRVCMCERPIQCDSVRLNACKRNLCCRIASQMWRSTAWHLTSARVPMRVSVVRDDGDGVAEQKLKTKERKKKKHTNRSFVHSFYCVLPWICWISYFSIQRNRMLLVRNERFILFILVFAALCCWLASGSGWCSHLSIQ